MAPASVSVKPPPAPELHPLFERLFREFGYANVTPDTLDVFLAAPGRKLLVFLDDPNRLKETLDLAVIAPELARAFAPHLSVGVLLPAAATAIAPKYGFRRWRAGRHRRRRYVARSRPLATGRLPESLAQLMRLRSLARPSS